MALSKLDSLYMAVVSDHSKHPHHRGKVADAEVLELHNPTCGDVIELSLRIDADGKIADIAFDGAGCTISTASASMMTDAVLGKTKARPWSWRKCSPGWCKASRKMCKKGWGKPPS